MAEHYLPLTEYSSKHKVSISTLRRRIKADEIKYVFEDGKYLILDEPSVANQKVHRPSQVSEQTLVREHRVFSDTTADQAPTSNVAPVQATFNPVASVHSAPARSFNPPPPAAPVVAAFSPPQRDDNVRVSAAASMEWHPEIKSLENKEGHEPILSAANQLLTQLKRAYASVLQEKEEQILHLKEEVSDLKTLVRVLESENERQRR